MYSNPASVAIAAFGLFSVVSSHGLVTSIKGANGVTMPGLSGEYSFLHPYTTSSYNSKLTTSPQLQSPMALLVTAPATAAVLRPIPPSSVTPTSRLASAVPLAAPRATAPSTPVS